MNRQLRVHLLSSMLSIPVLSFSAGANIDIQAGVCTIASCCSDNCYGVDISFPIHHDDIQADGNPLNSQAKRKLYNDFMDGCKAKYSSRPHACIHNERDRIEMNWHQPMSMFNYTTQGFYKTRAPPELMSLLANFWGNNTSPSAIHSIEDEQWPAGNTYTNHWASPTKMLNIQDLSLKGSGETLRSMIWDGTKIILKQWTGVELSPTSLYGVRVYTDGAVLAPHVDRNPLVISAIINVAQDVREDWPLEVIAHDGNAYNITMDVGDMILYESHSVIHGRPFPLNGDYYANVFCHFEPLERSLIDRKSVNHRFEDSLKTLYQDAWDRQRRLQKRKCGSDKQCFEHEFVDLNTAEKMPYYIVPKSREGKRWTLAQPDSQLSKLPKLNLIAHAAAAGNDLKALMHIAEADLNRIMEIDANGWTPLHEAVRGGHIEVASYLFSNGCNINQRTHHDTGGSPLWWAKRVHGDDHPIVKWLKSNGAFEIAPE